MGQLKRSIILNLFYRPSDFFSSEIKLKNIVVSKVEGSYLSHIEFDGVRYWDMRDNVQIKKIEIKHQLASSSLYREDRILLSQGNSKNLFLGQLDAAQKAKEKLEIIQRTDRKLREKFNKSSH